MFAEKKTMAADILSMLGSSWKEVPPEIALEHLRKPSIKPNTECESIDVPAEPEPMEIDTGKGKAVIVDPGTAQSDPGTSQRRTCDGVPVNSGTVPSQETVSVDIMVAISNWVDGILANPGIAHLNPGTSQCMSVATRSMRARPAVQEPAEEPVVPEDPMPVDQPVVPEDPMSVDQPDLPEDSMPVDESLFPECPVPIWAQQIMKYLVDGGLPEEEVEARKVQRRAKAFTIINRELYKRSVTGVLQRYVEPE